MAVEYSNKVLSAENHDDLSKYMNVQTAEGFQLVAITPLAFSKVLVTFVRETKETVAPVEPGMKVKS
jgi:hypothetical protein